MGTLYGLGLALAWLACVVCYLASPHQRLRAQPWPALAARSVGALLWVVSLALMGQGLQPVPAAFTVVTWTMLWLLLLPYLGLLRPRRAA